jgi:hypothetical protein
VRVVGFVGRVSFTTARAQSLRPVVSGSVKSCAPWAASSHASPAPPTAKRFKGLFRLPAGRVMLVQ